MKAADVMTRKVLCVTPSDSVRAAARLMLENHVSGLPVTDDQGHVVGMLTEGDLLERGEMATEPGVSPWRALWLGPQRLAERYVHAHGRTVQEVMTCDVIAVGGETPLGEVVALMESRGIRRLPVLENGRLVGIISRADLLRALSRLLPTQGPAASDAAIRADILRQIDQEHWAPRALVDIRVENGIVRLRGLVTSQQQRDGLKVLTENTTGVRQVVDEMVWVEPYTGMTVQA